MAKKKERISENLSDYATYFEEWFSFDYATDFEEWFSLDYSKLMPTDVLADKDGGKNYKI